MFKSRWEFAWIATGIALFGFAAGYSTPRATQFMVAAAKRPAPKVEVLAGVLSRVTDGDTVRLRDDAGTEHRVRFAHIDAPESRQPGGREAAAWLVQHVGERVEAHVTAKDRYGRLVAVLYDSAGQPFNKAIVEAGLAWWYEQYSDDATYGLAELRARRAMVGLWADDVPDEAPWDWRKR